LLARSQQVPPSFAQRIVVGMSGGVDSSVAAFLLKQQGHQVVGLFMKNWEEDDGTEYCTAKQDLADARQVADQLGIELHTANFAAEYWDQVFSHFLSEYRAGRTPNPDVLCNREIKFKVFAEYAELLGADQIATGHYARLDRQGGQTRLLKGLDANKDQSYFLHAVSAQQFARSHFPVGALQKSQVRQIAAQLGLATQSKKDSTGICFIGERRFRDFLTRYLPAQPGPIETAEGRRLGEHHGLLHHTIGQRQGLGVGGVHGAAEAPWYVAAKDLDRNTLIVVQGHDHPLLLADGLTTSALHWIDGEGPRLPCRLAAKTRYRQPDQPCWLEPAEDGRCRVRFDTPQRAVTQGQYVVFYQHEICLGGGVIETALPVMQPAQPFSPALRHGA